MDNIRNPYVFQYNEDVSVNSLDPIYIKSQSEIWIGTQLYEGLVSLDSQFQVVPALATRWEISENQNVYKFVIKPNVWFYHTDVKAWGETPCDSSRLTSYDVAYSFYRLIDPRTASPGAWIFSDKISAPNFEKTNYRSLAKLSTSPFFTPNDSTLIIQLKQPFSAFLSLLATNYAWVVSSQTENWPKGKLGRYSMGTGPFYLKKWEEDVKLVMLKNPKYHQFEGSQQLPYLQAVNVDFVKNKQTAFMQFASGKYDFFNGIDGSFKDDLLNRNGQLNAKYADRIHALITPFLNTEYIGFNLEDSVKGKINPLTDKNLRKALQWSVDRSALVKYLRNGLGTAGEFGFVPPILVGNNGLKSPMAGFDLVLASKFLQKSNYSSFKNKPNVAPITLTLTADYLDMGVFLQEAWKKIGVEVSIDIQTGGMLRQLRNQGQLTMFRGSWIADYPDAENYLGCFYSPYFSPNGPNYTHFKREKFDQYYEDIVYKSQPESNERKQKIAAADNYIMEEAPVLILYYDKSLRLMHPYVKGLRNDATNRLDLKKVRKEFKN